MTNISAYSVTCTGVDSRRENAPISAGSTGGLWASRHPNRANSRSHRSKPMSACTLIQNA